MQIKRMTAGLRVTAIAVVATSVALASSTGPISEETPPATCDPGSFVTEIRCSGKFCDNIKTTCRRFNAAEVGSASWTSWISEEGSGTRSCPAPRHFMAGLACQGRYCDKVSLYCVEIRNARNLNCRTTRKVSEENGGKLSFFRGDAAGQNFLANGIKCSGRYCDNKAFQSCEVDFQ